MSEKEFTVYELGFLLNPILTADESADFVNNFRLNFENLGGEYIIHSSPKEISLQFEISREIQNKKVWFQKAIFGWIKFRFESKEINKIENLVKNDEKILRYLLIKTVEDNTLYADRVTGFKKRREKKIKSEEFVSEEMNKEEVDKKIDELVLEA